MLPNGLMQYIIAEPPQYCYGLSGCQMTVTHQEVRDSIPPKDENWREEICYGAKWGNKICVTGYLRNIPLDDPLSFVDQATKEILAEKQVLIIRDAGCGLIISFADREKEKELFGEDEEARGIGISAIKHCIPEVYREIQRNKQEEKVSA